MRSSPPRRLVPSPPFYRVRRRLRRRLLKAKRFHLKLLFDGLYIYIYIYVSVYVCISHVCTYMRIYLYTYMIFSLHSDIVSLFLSVYRRAFSSLSAAEINISVFLILSLSLSLFRSLHSRALSCLYNITILDPTTVNS